MKKILVAIPVTEEQIQLFSEASKGGEIRFIKAQDVSENDLSDISAIIGNIRPQLLKYAKKLEWLQLNSAGYDAYIKNGILSDEVCLTNASGAYGVAVSEHMLALTLMLQKKLHLYRDNMHAALWHDEGKVTSPMGSKVLIFGTGDIGCEYAKRMSLCGAHVYGIRRKTDEKLPYFEALYKMDDVDKIMPEADITALALPASDSLYHFFNKEMFSLMKHGSLFINVGRGTLVDQNALLEALKSGQLSGAAIDVSEPEPLEADSPLWNERNLIITPHTAGGFRLDHTLEKIVELSVDNLRLYMLGKPLKMTVNRK